MPYGVVVLLLELDLAIGLQGTMGLFQKGQMIALFHSHKKVRLFLLGYFLEIGKEGFSLDPEHDEKQL